MIQGIEEALRGEMMYQEADQIVSVPEMISNGEKGYYTFRKLSLFGGKTDDSPTSLDFEWPSPTDLTSNPCSNNFYYPSVQLQSIEITQILLKDSFSVQGLG